MFTSVLSRTEYPALKVTHVQSKFPLRTKTTKEEYPETHVILEKNAITNLHAIQFPCQGC